MKRDTERASAAARRAVDGSGLNRTQFSERAGLDLGTVVDFLEGRRWPQGPTRLKIERALDWPAGRLLDIADGRDSEPGTVIEAVQNDPNLLPEAKEHLVRQYELLLRVRAAETREQAERGLRAVLADEVGQPVRPD